MKIEYDVSLYRKIARLRLNEIVQVSNRKGRRTTISITNITTLSWHELQLLMPEGADRFTKMVLLYRAYLTQQNISSSTLKGTPLSKAEVDEITAYINIFYQNNFREHYQVNELITQNDDWDMFPTIRSLNDHGEYKEIEGIQPKYFEVVCNILKLSQFHGRPLDSFKAY